MIPERNHLSKLYVETTTRCNLRCAMCVKQAEGANIPEQDMGMEVFEALAPCFSHLDGLLLNGIGEPLLTPRLAEMISLARARMRPDATIGFQTNGMLLTEKRAEELVRAGLNTVCLSVDMVGDNGLFHGGEDVTGTARVFGRLRRAERQTGSCLRIGVEFVLMRDTLDGLPRSLAWAANQGADFALVTHMLPYGEGTADQELFNPNTDESMAEFARWQVEAADLGIDLASYYGLPWKFNKTPEEARVVDFVNTRRNAALARGVPIHFNQLLHWSTPEKRADQAHLEAVLAEAREVADRTGLDAVLPGACAALDRRCDFVEQGVAHVTPAGDVRPCYFLWHEYGCRMEGHAKKVLPRTFGNVLETPLADIWQDPDYCAFREEVLAYDYPYCTNCPVMPCSDVTGQGRPFERDCKGIDVPCGHCAWCMGGVRCLL